MKIKNYLALTLMAAVSFAACDKGENGADGDKSPKSVILCSMSCPEPALPMIPWPATAK